MVVTILFSLRTDLSLMGAPRNTLKQKYETGIKAICKIVQERNQLKNSSVGSNVQNINTGQCIDEQQAKYVFDQLQRLEQERALTNQNIWLFKGSKIKKIIMIAILSGITLNLCVWGAMKMYFRLNRRRNTAGRHSTEIQSVLLEVQRQANDPIQQIAVLVQKLDAARQDYNNLRRDYDKVYDSCQQSFRQVKAARAGGGG